MNREINRLSEHILVLPPEAETDRPILAAISGKKHTLIVDTGNSPAHAELFLAELASHQVPNLRLAALTHWHWDHSFGARRMDLLTIAHEKTKKALDNLMNLKWTDKALNARVKKGTEHPFCAEMIKKELGPNRDIALALPDLTFSKKIEVDLGGVHCIIEHVGGDHAEDSSVVYVEEDKVLFLGDCLYASLHGSKYTVNSMLSLLDKLEKYNADTYVLSHELPMPKDVFRGYAELLRLLCRLTAKTAGDKALMTAEFSSILNREPNQIESEAMDCFINGANQK